MSLLQKLVELNPLTTLLNYIFKKVTLFQQLASYLSGLLFNGGNIKTKNLMFLIGLSSITMRAFINIYKTSKFLSFIPQYLKNKNKYNNGENLIKKYGKCSALITGSADGIGYAYSRQFAKLGFDLIMVDINSAKLSQRSETIKYDYPNVKVKTFVVDMSKTQNIQQLIKDVQDDQIGIIINNVGVGAGGLYLDIGIKPLTLSLFVNFRAMYLLNRKMIPKLRNRKYRSLMINMTSATGYFVSHRVGTYSSVKLAADIYSQNLTKQNQDKIDVLTVRPFGVSTNIVKMRKQQRFITPKQCVEGVMYDIGNAKTSFGGFQHRILGSFFNSITFNERLQKYQQKWKLNNVAK